MNGSVTTQGLCKQFGGSDVLRDISLEIPDGTFAVIVGPSGCGKTTLLRIIAGLEEASSGDLNIGCERVNSVEPAKRGIAMVFQSYALYPHMTVFQNMAFGLKFLKVPKDEVEDRVRRAAEMLVIDELLSRKPASLSGGQRQRVAIGRAIVREPRVFLFDEPLSNLDAALRVSTRVELASLHRRLKATMIYVTHDQAEAMTLAETLIVMNEGQVEQVGPPVEIYRRPANRFVAGFLGNPGMNFIRGKVAEKNSAFEIGVRPEHVVITSESSHGYPGHITHAEHMGSETHLFVDVDELGPVTLRLPGIYECVVGAACRVDFPTDSIHRFDAEGRAMS